MIRTGQETEDFEISVDNRLFLCNIVFFFQLFLLNPSL